MLDFRARLQRRETSTIERATSRKVLLALGEHAGPRL